MHLGVTGPPSSSGHPSLQEWIKQLQTDLQTATQNIAATTETPDVDRHLLHLWEARRGLTRRWRRQKHNRKLRLRIARLDTEAADYANTLTSNNWHSLCDRLSGTLSTPRTWSLLRALLNPTQTKLHTANTVRTILHKSGLDDTTLLHTLQQRYIATGTRPTYRDYPHVDATPRRRYYRSRG